jgi:ABC-2 type transport system permease protein
MTRRRIFNILHKEWRVLAGDLNSLLLVTLLPFLIVGQAILYIWLIQNFAGETMATSQFFQGTLEKLMAAVPGAADLPVADQIKVLLLTQFNFFLLLVPTMIAMNSAAFSIVEEKLSRSLEPLLATPVRTWELLLGKALSGAIPALIMTWLCAGVFLGGVSGLGWGHLLTFVLTASWFSSLFFLTPAVAVLSFLLGVIGSSRAKDARSAQNVALFIIFPVFGLIAVQVTGVVWFTPWLTFILGLVISLIDILVLKVAVGLFRRESIVVRWR